MALSRQEAVRRSKVLQNKVTADSEEMQRAKQILDFCDRYISRRPCTITFSDGHTYETHYGFIFNNEESYSWFKFLKDSGKAYPVKVDVGYLKDETKGDKDIAQTMSEVTTQALEHIYSGKTKVPPLNQKDIDQVMMLAERKRML